MVEIPQFSSRHSPFSHRINNGSPPLHCTVNVSAVAVRMVIAATGVAQPSDLDSRSAANMYLDSDARGAGELTVLIGSVTIGLSLLVGALAAGTGEAGTEAVGTTTGGEDA